VHLFRRKPVDQLTSEAEHGLRRALGKWDLTALGVGAIIGAGIFAATGSAIAGGASHTGAGPAIVISFVITGIACGFAALCYAEFAAMIPVAGSAYTYAYAALGELIAWIIGWDLILEYGVATSAVAIGWSAYAANALQAAGLTLPPFLVNGPLEGGVINLPASLIVLSLAILLGIGVRESARVNGVMVLIKLLAIAVFVVVASSHVNPAHWNPFMPFGWGGVMGGAALIFFAYIGFDAVSTAAEEARNPQRDLPIGILTSLAVCTLIYILVAGLLTGVAPYPSLNVASPVADVMLRLGYPWVAGMISAGAIAGLTTVMLVLFYGLTRVFLAMSRDGLLPPVFARLHPRTATPVRVILVAGASMAAIAGLIPIGTVAELVNVGTLAAFFLVCLGVIGLRHTHPDIPRPFRTPFSPLVPVLGAASCLYLTVQLPGVTWARFGIWLGLGLILYFGYSRNHSTLATT
jgi:APA family basic amino acid/polyamine antiporter